MAGDFDVSNGDLDANVRGEFAPTTNSEGYIPLSQLSDHTLSRDGAVADEREYVKGRKQLETLGDPEE